MFVFLIYLFIYVGEGGLKCRSRLHRRITAKQCFTLLNYQKWPSPEREQCEVQYYFGGFMEVYFQGNFYCLWQYKRKRIKEHLAESLQGTSCKWWQVQLHRSSPPTLTCLCNSKSLQAMVWFFQLCYSAETGEAVHYLQHTISLWSTPFMWEK